jgi:hypothetical protein
MSSDEETEDVPDPRPLMMNPPKPVEVDPEDTGLTSGVGLGVVSSSLSLGSSAEPLADASPVLEGVAVSGVRVESSSSAILLGTTSDCAVANTVVVSTVSVVSMAALRLISVSEPFSVGQNGVCVLVSTIVSTTVTHTS